MPRTDRSIRLRCAARSSARCGGSRSFRSFSRSTIPICGSSRRRLNRFERQLYERLGALPCRRCFDRSRTSGRFSKKIARARSRGSSSSFARRTVTSPPARTPRSNSRRANGARCSIRTISFADHALAFVALEIEQHPDAGLIYSDEDKIDADGVRSNPFFKPDWNPELFLGQNFINHLGVYRTELLREIGGFREGFEGSQDYDLALRCVERLKPAQVRHIPRILYHWRAVAGSLAAVADAKPYAKEAARRAIGDHLQRQRNRGPRGTVSGKCRIASRGLRAAGAGPAGFDHHSDARSGQSARALPRSDPRTNRLSAD